MTTLQLIVLLFVGIAYAELEDSICPTVRCSHDTVQCAYCDGEYRFFRSECAVRNYNCVNANSPCRIVDLKYCLDKACPVPCKYICATDGEKHYIFKSECDYFNHICKTKKPLKEVDVKNCIAQISTSESF